MTIFIVSANLFKGGAEHVGAMLANGFALWGNDVFLLSDLNLPIEYQINSNVKVLGIFSNTSNKIAKWGGAIAFLRKEIKTIRPDIIIGVSETCSLIAKIASIGLRTRVIYSAHNSFERPATAPMGRWNKFAKFWLGRLYDATTVLTEADKKYIGNKLSNVSVKPNPLGLQPVLDIPQKQKTILSAGRLDGWHVKGFDVLIKSFAKLLNGSKVAEPRSMFKSNDIAFKIREEGWKLQIAGTGSEESLNYLKQLCRENGVEDWVEFLGFRKDVEMLYQDASIFVLSSRYEGFGLVLIEAMSQGCACVACDYKGRQREIMNPEGQGSKFNVQSSNNKVELCETGILCEPDDVESLAEAMRKMMMDDEYRESVRAKAIERSKYYSIENTMDRWETLLKQVTGVKQL